MPQDQVFISYSHKDKKWLNEFETHLKPYLRDGILSTWSDHQIQPGSQWFNEIQSQLASSKIALLLVSPDFLNSDFIHEHELGPLLKEAEQGGVKILWVPIYDTAYKKTALKNYQAVLDPGKPLGGMTKAKRGQAWIRICEEIERAVNKPREPQALFVGQSRSAAQRAVGEEEVPANVGEKCKPRLITSIEFILERPFTEFDEEKFKIALKLATGIDAAQIRIASIRSGSTILQIDGEQKTLAAIIRKIRGSQQVAHQLAINIGLRKIAWDIEGRRYELAVDEPLQSATSGAIFKERASSDEDPAVRWAAVQKLVSGWKYDPDTLRILKERASSDEDSAVRQAAVLELARGWKEDPDTLAWLKERASSDEDSAVRQAAVLELAWGWKEDPDTLAWLKERASSDEDPVVRQAAVHELAKGWKKDSDTLPWLKQRASSDENWTVRWAAVQELVKGWKEDPDTFRILKEQEREARAFSNVSEEVCRTAPSLVTKRNPRKGEARQRRPKNHAK